jgi:hypothetical protein
VIFTGYLVALEQKNLDGYEGLAICLGLAKQKMHTEFSWRKLLGSAYLQYKEEDIDFKSYTRM